MRVVKVHERNAAKQWRIIEWKNGGHLLLLSMNLVSISREWGAAFFARRSTQKCEKRNLSRPSGGEGPLHAFSSRREPTVEDVSDCGGTLKGESRRNRHKDGIDGWRTQLTLVTFVRRWSRAPYLPTHNGRHVTRAFLFEFLMNLATQQSINYVLSIKGSQWCLQIYLCNQPCKERWSRFFLLFWTTYIHMYN
jgi:hypothetical protein